MILAAFQYFTFNDDESMEEIYNLERLNKNKNNKKIKAQNYFHETVEFPQIMDEFTQKELSFMFKFKV